MEARLLTVLLLVSTFASLGADYVHKTENFVVTASSEEIAKAVGETAEECRKRLAVEWLGHELNPWYKPCPIFVKAGAMGAGGWTKFTFVPYQNVIAVNQWDMKVQGTVERILDSVIPHEVTHTILATHFLRPLPRWADEGASTLAEHESERRRQLLTLKQVLQSNQAIPLRQLLDMKDYPSDMQKVYTLYAQGYSLADYLVQQGGRSKFLRFLNSSHREGNWDRPLQQMYAYQGIADLETQWKEWVMSGSPDLVVENGRRVPAARATARTSGTAKAATAQTSPGQKAANQVAANTSRPAARRQTEIRAQSPNEDPFLEPEAFALDGRTRPSTAKPLPEQKQVAMVEPERPAASDSLQTLPDDQIPSYGNGDQPRAMPDDDVWELELVPATILQSTTRKRGTSREAAPANSPRAERALPQPVRPRRSGLASVGTAKPARRMQSEFPQEFQWNGDRHVAERD